MDPIRSSAKHATDANFTAVRGAFRRARGSASRQRWQACAMAVALSLTNAAAHAAALPVISFAEQTVQLIRGTATYAASPGTRLQGGDIIQSGASGLQIEGLANATLALGSETRLYIEKIGPATELHLLSGWLKAQPAGAATASALAVQFGALRLEVGAGTSVLHATQEKAEIFVEQGTQSLAELDKRGQAERRNPLAREQYAVRTAYLPLQLAGRPGKEFVAAMPKQFFDALVPVAGKLGAEAVPQKQHEVAYEDIAPWLAGGAGNERQAWIPRFSPRLSDPLFRKKVGDELGGTVEWKAVLDQQDRKKTAIKNNLF
jgi:hypothetical protein